MAIRNRNERPNGDKIEIDLSGPDGNAFVLLKLASNLCNRLGYSEEKRERVLDEISFTASDKTGEKILINKEYIKKNLGDLVSDTDLSKFIL